MRSSATTERPRLSKVTLTSFTRTLGSRVGIGRRRGLYPYWREAHALGAARLADARAGLTARAADRPVRCATGPPLVRLLQVVDSGSADLRVLGRGDTGDTHRAHPPAPADQRETAPQRGGAPQ